ncbi:MAG: hypothetical protein IH803_08590 [Nitrospirae bacterium]|nr:hypothetical protein [Nitrospirota bacterium]
MFRDEVPAGDYTIPIGLPDVKRVFVPHPIQDRVTHPRSALLGKPEVTPGVPYITSTLQQAASTRMGFSVKKTMMLAQRLYEAGHITYMRTDSTNLSQEAIGACRELIGRRFGDRYLPQAPNAYSNKNGAQEAHEAIRPTQIDLVPERLEKSLNKDQFRLYELIWRRFLASQMTPAEIERFVRDCRNPYDLLVTADVASLLDLGAGDLSFACELVEQYLPRLAQQQKRLTVHCIDRLQPGSSLGGILHAEEGRLEKLRQWTSPHLEFKFWGDQDMFELEQLKNIWPRYTMVTCHAPATPTFAYEPTRVSPSIIEQHLRRTKGEYRIVRAGGERALEVLHGGRVLLFPPWKFEVRGPLALLDLLSRRGKLCVLSAVDTEVFWEVLSQLVADPAARPPDVVLSPAMAAEQFGPLYARLSELQPGETCMLSEEAPLRQDMPRMLGTSGAGAAPYRFRYAEVRRGTVFEGMPASRTARQFTNMKEEAPPWLLLLVPDTAHQ